MRRIHPRLQLPPVGLAEAPQPELGYVVPDRTVRSSRDEGSVAHVDGAAAGDDLAPHLVAVACVDEGFDLHERPALGREDDQHRVEFPLGSVRPRSSDDHLDRGVFIVQKPPIDIDLMDRGVGQRARAGQAIGRECVAVHVVHDQRCAHRRDRRLQVHVSRVEAAHEPKGEQSSPQSDLGIDHAGGVGDGGGERLLAQRGPLRL